VSMAYFEVNNLIVHHRTYEGVETVLDIDHFEIDKGTTFGIVGESGQGKTVLALTILQLLQCPPGEIISGEILLDGIDLLKVSQRKMQQQIRGRKIAMIFQDPMSCMNPVFTVGKQMLDVIAKNRGLKGTEALDFAIDMLGRVRLSDAENTLTKYPHQLSGGQRQRVVIALALCCGAEFLIADEPTRNLDVTIQASILLLLKELQTKLNMTVLFISNSMGLVSAFCDRTAILSGGKIIEQGNTSDIILNPQQAYTKLLVEAASLSNKSAPAHSGVEVLLKVEHLKKYFEVSKGLSKNKQQLKAVDDVSFELKKGEVLGIVGESGCGKSTLVNTILSLFEPTGGDVWFEGQNAFLKKKKTDNAFKKNVQIVFQDPFWSLNPRWFVKDIVAEPIDAYGKLKGGERLSRVNKLLEMVGLHKEDAFKYPHEFSGGQRQRIAIARSLASNPKLVVLDEPTSSIDVFSQAQILGLLKDLKDEFNLTNILISHDLGVVNQMANKIAVMYLGKIVEFGPASEVFNDPRHPYTKALFNSIPKIDKMGMENIVTLEGTIPSPINPPSGCSFHTRCANACEACSEWNPYPIYVDKEHYVSCILYEETKEE
jgi:oligopeptide/dipeptide ABC transporter ATP-binding protein